MLFLDPTGLADVVDKLKLCLASFFNLTQSSMLVITNLLAYFTDEYVEPNSYSFKSVRVPL